MISLKFLHASYECIATLDGLSVIARSTETTYRAMALYANHTLADSEVEEVLLEFLILRSHDEAEVHQ